jgi:hypothetical protein
MKHQYSGDITDLFKFDLLGSLNKVLSLSGVTICYYAYRKQS